MEQHRPLASEPERDAVRGRGGGERAVDLTRRGRAARHPGHHQGRADRAAEQGRRQIDVGRGALGQRAVDQVDVFEQRRPVERRRARCGDRQVIGLALADAAVRHEAYPYRTFARAPSSRHLNFQNQLKI
jgi:hypothetical protein